MVEDDCVVVQVIKDYQLMGIVCILVLVDVFVLTVWEFVDPLVIVVSNKTLETIVSLNSSATRCSNCPGEGVRRLNPLSSLERPPSSAKFQPTRGVAATPLAHWQ